MVHPAGFNSSLASISKILRVLSERTNFKKGGKTVIQSQWIVRHSRRSWGSKNQYFFQKVNQNLRKWDKVSRWLQFCGNCCGCKAQGSKNVTIVSVVFYSLPTDGRWKNCLTFKYKNQSKYWGNNWKSAATLSFNRHANRHSNIISTNSCFSYVLLSLVKIYVTKLYILRTQHSLLKN